MFSIDLTRADTAPFTPAPEHDTLRSFVGVWRGPSRLWADPSAPPEESITELSAQLVLGGRWLRIDYRGVAFGKPHAGEMLVGFHKDAALYELAWVDSSHTGSAIMLSVGPAQVPGIVEVLGSYAAGEQRWGWRTRLGRPDADALSWEAFNIAPDGTSHDAFSASLSRLS